MAIASPRRTAMPPALLPALLALVLLLPVALAQQRVLVGALSTLDHDVSGTVYAIDSRTLEVENFFYDGKGPAAVFWVGTGAVSANGKAAPTTETCERMRLRSYSGQTVRFELPLGTTINDIDYVSVWCDAVGVDFGNVRVPASVKTNVPQATGPRACSEAGTFPVQNGWNCETLNDFYQVRWKLNGANIDFELVGKVNPGYWMGFGVSGSATKTQMVGSDVVIATERNNRIQAEDYFLSAQAQCANGAGVCPDTVSTDGPGQNNVQGVVGRRELDTLQVNFSRPIAATDNAVDKAFRVGAGEMTFVTWATGPFNQESNIPQIHTGDMSFPRTSFSFEFGRTAANKCETPLVAQEIKDESIDAWTREPILNVTDITARIGPSGEERGVAGITGGPSWGIAWYMSPTNTIGNDTLIPAIAVERNKTYTFRVFGGDNSANSARHHPLYITNDTDGGFATKTPDQRRSERIFAGINVTKREANGSITGFIPTAMGKLCSIDTTAVGADVNKFKTFAEFKTTLNTSCASSIPLSDAGVLNWTVPGDAPDLLYYQCVTHRDLGFKLVVFDEGKVDVERLRLESGGGPRDESACSVLFKGQALTFDGCADVTSDFRVWWSFRGNNIETLFEARTTAGWAGFSLGNREMVPANAVIAFRLQNGTVDISDYSLQGKTTAGVQPANNQKLTNLEAEAVPGRILGRFTRPLSGPGIKRIEKDKTPVLWAVGPVSTAPTALDKHSTKGTTIVDLAKIGNQQGVKQGDPDKQLFIAHGLLMGISWIILVPIAVISMRFFKAMNPATFQVHRAVNGVAVIAVLIAFIMGIARGNHLDRKHLGIGVVVTILALSQGINGALRPHKETSGRKPWFLFHAYSGRIVVVLAVINVFFGIDAYSRLYGNVSNWRIVVGVLVGFFGAVKIVLSLMPGRFPVVEEGPLLPSDSEKRRSDL